MNGLNELRKDFVDRAPKLIAQAEIADDKEAVFWRDGMGVYAHVVFVGHPYDGEEGVYPVGGDLFWAFNGALHLRTLRPRQPVLVELLERSTNGHGVITSRVTTDKSNPVVSAGFRKLAGNFDAHNFDVFGDGEDYHLETVNGSVWIRVNKTGNFVVNTPDGGSFAYVHDAKAWKLKAGGGASLTVGADGVSLKSPDGTSFLEVTDKGVSLSGKFTRIDGTSALMLNMGASDTPVPLTQGVAYGATGPANLCSTSVFVGK